MRGARAEGGPKILHIEDNAENRALVRALLEAAGYTVVEAEDGLQGIEVALREEPALILLDINLPEVDGYEVGVLLKSFPTLSTTPVVAVTAYAMEGDRQRTLAAGCDGYIQKPIDVDAFPAQVAEFLRGRRERIEEREAAPYLRELNQRLVYRLVSQVEELGRLNQHFMRRATQLEELHAAMEGVTAELGVQGLLERLLPALARALGSESLTVELTDPPGMRVSATGRAAAPVRVRLAGEATPEDWTEVEWTVGLHVRERALGVLTARHRVPAGAKADEEQLLKVVAAQVAIAVENARLYAETRARLRQTETLLAVSQAVSSTLDVAEVARRAVRALVQALGADMGGAWRLSPAHDRLEPLAGYRVPKDLFSRLSAAQATSGAPLLDLVRQTDGVVYAADSSRDPRIDHPLLRLLPHRSVLVVPMRVKDEVVGGFAVVWTRPVRALTEEELRLVEGIARQAAVALDNARLLEAERQAREELARSEVRYRDLFENVIDLVYLHDAEGRLLEINEAGLRATGYDRHELVGRPVVELWAPEDRERAALMIRRLVGGERPVESFVGELVTRDGTRRVLEAVGRTVVKGSDPPAVLVSARDITVRRRLERRQEALVTLSRELATEVELDRLLPRIVEEARRLMAVDTAVLLLDEGGALEVRAAAGMEPEPVGPEWVGALRAAAEPALLERRPVTYANLAADAGWRTSPLVVHGYCALLAVPLAVQERTLGLLELLHRDARAFPAEEIEFLRALATQAALAIDNARLFAARREEAEISAGLLRLAEAIEGAQALDQVLDTVVRTSAELLGCTQCLLFLLEPGSGRLTPAVAAGLPAEQRPALEALRGFETLPAVARALETQDPMVLEPPADHSLAPALAALGLSAMLVVPLVSGGRLMGVLAAHTPGQSRSFTQKEVALGRGIAAHAAVALDKARLFEQTQTRLRETETLLAITQAVSSTLDPAEALRRVAREMARALGADMVGAYLADPEGEFLHPVAGYRVPAHLRESLLRHPIPVGGHPAVEEAWRTRHAVWTDDAPGDVRIHRETFARFPHQSLLFVPMLAKGEPVGGFFAVWWQRRRRLGPEEVRLVEAMSDQAAMFVENARLYAEAQRRRREAEELARLARMLTESLDAADVGERIVQGALGLLEGTFSTLRLLEPDGSLKLITAKGDPRVISALPAVVPAGWGVPGRAVRDGRPVACPDGLADLGADVPPEARERLAALGGFAFLAVPLRVKRETIGALGVGARAGRRFSEAEAALLQTFADQAAIALENSRLYGDLRAALQAVEESQQRIVQGERLRALGEMAGGVAHDFNNVLAIIVGRAEVLLGETEDPELRRQLEVIIKVAMDAAQTVRRIQEFTRMRRARPFQQVNLNQVVEEMVDVTRSRWKDEAQARGIRYEMVVETAPTPPILGDPSEIREALTNIIFNALDAMPDGGRVTLRTGVEGDRVICAVADTGIGMSDEVRRRIFDPFFTTKGERGTGLGLSVVYGIMTRHNAEIDVRSRPGHGTTFVLKFPLGGEVGAEAPSPAAAGVRGPGRVLVIDDEPEVGAILHDLLRRDGHTVVVCQEAETGLARLAAEPFDVVITDLGMPNLSGWEVVRHVKRTRPGTPVIMVTGWGDRIDLAEARARGVDYLVAKPFKREQLQALIATALGAAGQPSSSG